MMQRNVLFTQIIYIPSIKYYNVPNSILRSLTGSKVERKIQSLRKGYNFHETSVFILIHLMNI